MGVPKFFRYISERYPCLSELVKEYEIPEFDNLYLDMNGIIHMCSHPDDFDPHFRISEEKMFNDIFHYIEALFQMIKPQKVFFMAVDGVAPRAKMNQQRGRRFRSAKEAEDLEAKAKSRGEKLPEEARFDSNCITPGTVFMDRLQQQLKYFVQQKISTDKLWQKCKIILSGHETPGEGEHKIMDYIRYIKAQSGYNLNTRHCLYGLDADLIMLGLCSHEPHFSLLREEVRFGKKVKRKNVPEQINFYLLHLSLMREYLELEFLPLKDSLPFNYDMEKIIDDWVLMGFLIGNDFIPHLPNLHIASGALPVLYNAYMKILPTLDGYINEGGTLNLPRFEKFLKALATIEIDNFSEHYADLKYFESKTGRRPNNKERTSYKNRFLVEWNDDDEDSDKLTDPALAALLKSTDYLLEPEKSGNQNKELKNVCESKMKDPKNSKQELLADTSNMLLQPEQSSNWNMEVKNVCELKFKDSKHGPLIDTSNMLAELKIDDNTFEINKEENSSDSNTKDLVDKSIKDAVKEISYEDIGNKDQILVDLSEDSVEPSQNNLENIALENIELEDDEEAEGSPYYSDDYDSDDDDELREAEFLQHKNDYYMNKLDYSQVTADVLRSQAEGYVRAIQWNLNYYYNGCCSWSWYYPHHYAPYISDIKDFSSLELKYDMGKPFQPFEQLLAVLPSASKQLLPEVYQYLMTSEESLIIEYYPHDFKTDLNGKKQEWEAVVLIPFIAENLLLDAMAPCNEKLTPDEVRRNTHGPMLIYEYTKECQGVVEAPQYYPTIEKSYAKLTPVTIQELRVPKEKLVKGPCPGAITDTYYPGFPTFKHLKYKAHLKKAKVKVFDQPSQNESMIITIQSPENRETDIHKLAQKLIGKSVYVGWPHLTEALVVGVSNEDCKKIRTSKSGEFITELNRGNLASLWKTMKNATTSFHKVRLGIDVGDADILVHVKGFIGQKYAFTSTGSISVEKQWNIVESVYSLDAIVPHLDVSVSEKLTFKNIQELFPLGSHVYMLGNPHYGAKGEVIDNTSLKSGRIKVNMYAVPEPDFSGLYRLQQELKYMPAGEASRRLAITPHLLSRITGSIFIIPAEKADRDDGRGKVNIGLNLKLNKKCQETPGYTRKVDGTWLYSPKAVKLVHDYMENYPQLFTFINKNMGNDVYSEKEIFPDDIGKGKIKEITEWLKKQSFSSVEYQTVGTLNVDPEIVEKIEEVVDEFKLHHNAGKQIVMQVKPHLLYKPEVQTGLLPPDVSAAFNLYDRVVNVRQSYTVPYGLKGTVIGIRTENKNDVKNGIEVMYDVVFDETFAGGLPLNCSSGRGYRCPKPALINISHGMRVVQQKTVNPATNNPYYTPKVPPPRLQQGFNQFPMRGQNSAFVNCNPNRGPRGYGHPPPRPLFQPPFMNRDGPVRGQFGGPQQPPLRPPGMQQPKQGAPGAEFTAFFQDLQRNQNKQNNYTHPHNNYQRNYNQQQPFNQAQNFSIQSTSQASTNQAVNDETEALKKLLKISEKQNSESLHNNKPTASEIKSTQPISVQDFFAHARNQERKVKSSSQGENSTTFYCVQLLNYCHEKGKGIPRYNFLNVPDGKFRAQIVLLDGRASIGDEATTKQEASELAAKKMLNEIVQNKNQESNQGQNFGNAMKPSGFPSPPKQWCQNESKSPRSQQNANSSNQKQVKVLSPHKKNDQAAQNTKSTFVPLQAVKQHRQRTASNKNEENKSHNVSSNKNDNSGSSHKGHYGNDSKQQHHKNESSAKPKPRKSRIAANFSAAPKK